MRMMAKVELGDVEKVNEVVRSGHVQQVFQTVMDRLQPEAIYFGPVNGNRGCYIILNMEDSSYLPFFSEPFFQEMNATIEWLPLMSGDELQRGLQRLSSE